MPPKETESRRPNFSIPDGLTSVIALDADKTLLQIGPKKKVGSEGLEVQEEILNEALLQSLEATECRDIVLFTNMNLVNDFDKLNPENENLRITRARLIQQLEARGFSVHVV